jgi:hypothetical protein
MERASLDEDAATFILAACSLIILGAGLRRVVKAQASTTNAVNRWSLGAGNRSGHNSDTQRFQRRARARSDWNSEAQSDGL